MTKKNRVLAILLAVFVLFVMLVSTLCVAEKADHDCTGDVSCPICQEIFVCERTLHNLSSAAVVMVSVFAAVSFAILGVMYCVHAVISATLVSLKVKLSN